MEIKWLTIETFCNYHTAMGEVIVIKVEYNVHICKLEYISG